MIVTKSWLAEWIDLENVSTDYLCKTLNAIGLEVDGTKQHRIPEKIVVGYVVSCEKHPDADKLSICQIDLGNATRQIVCGAKNIAAGQYVPVATVGAIMPNGMKIKHAKLRGVESDGMVCSATELGLPKTDDGIMVLDESIGDLEPGALLCENPCLNDDVIEIELTANRGDCLSIFGVARELSVALQRPMKPFDEKRNGNTSIGIGRVLHFTHKGNPAVNLLYRVIEVASWKIPLLLRLRLGFIQAEYSLDSDAYLFYATHATGVVLREYGAAKLYKENNKSQLILEETPDKLGKLYSGKEFVSIVGIYQRPSFKGDEKEHQFVLEASYVEPQRIAPIVKRDGLKTDELYYRTSRGSEPDLEFGMSYLVSLLQRYLDVQLYNGCSEYINEIETKTLDLTVEEIAGLIGQTIEMTTVVNILSKLGFVIHRVENGHIVFDLPLFRHDIVNKQDVIEEIVRIVGIDNIDAKPLCFEESNRMTKDLAQYRFLRDLRLKAVGNGFYETIHYVFCDNTLLEKLGFEPIKSEKALLNPITGEMNGLRPSLMVTMLDSLKRNVAMSKRRIALFESGKVFDKERNEFTRFIIAYAGEKEGPGITNAGKPKMINFADFVQKVSAVVGAFDLVSCEAKNGLMHPYQSAEVLIEDENVGVISKLHPMVAKDFDLPDTYFAELELTKLQARHIQAHPISQFTPVLRDLSIVVPQELPYARIREALRNRLPEYVEKFYPIDRYVDESLGDRMSLTLRFELSSMEKTLEEPEINRVIDEALQVLEETCEARLR